MQGRRRIAGAVKRGDAFQIVVDGRPIDAYEGETIAAALVASGVTTFRYGPDGSPRGLFCGMGICFECRMTVNGIPNVQTCITRAEPGMLVETQSEEGLARGNS